MSENNSGSFIKHEPDDQSNPNQFMMAQNPYGIPSPASFGNQFGNSVGNDGVDPSDLTMQNGGFMSNTFGSQNLSTSFNYGNSAIDTSELLDLDFSGQAMSRDNSMGMVPEQRQPTGISMSHQGQMSHIYSETPDGAPIQSPFLRANFNYDQFRQQHTPHASSPHMGNIPFHRAGFPNSSDPRSPNTPKTPALAGLNIGTPESGSFPSQPIRVGSLQHHKTLSTQWDGTPGSGPSIMESPISSPGQHHHLGISEMLKSGKHASLPAKVDLGHGPHSTSAQALESQEAKRRRRRASHNMVERRRRDNINERIQDLSHLVPHHRLEDDKIRKQLLNNSALGSGVGSTISTSNAATSLLAGSGGRRATAGNITMGLPIEEKEKGPNKGDILNGAVAWTRDLMWALHRKIQQEDQLAEYIESLGGSWPFEQTEEDKRMRTEILDAMEKNDPGSFNYTRSPGSGLRVPKHTNIAGEPLPPEDQPQRPQTQSQQPSQQTNGSMGSQSLSPGYRNGGSGASSGSNQPQFWNSAGHAGISFKEEDEYNMDMN